MNFSLINASWQTLLLVIIATVCTYLFLIVLARIVGLRSFSNMSGFDFVVTIALGSMIANTIVARDPPLLIAATAFVTLLSLETIVERFRYKPPKISKFLENKPLLLMKDEKVIEKNMIKARVSYGELYAALRKKGVTKISHVKAAVLETTGEVSVLQHSNPEYEIDDVLLSEVQK